MKPKVVLAFSGGLDTTYCAIWLREQGFDVHTVTVMTDALLAGTRSSSSRCTRRSSGW